MELYRKDQPLFLDANKVVSFIEEDIFKNQKDLDNLRLWYNRKYSGLSDRLNSVNLTINNQEVYLTIKNKYVKLRKVYSYMNKELKEVSEIKVNLEKWNPQSDLYWERVLPSKTKEERDYYKNRFGKIKK